jgi:hypothetical protein
MIRSALLRAFGACALLALIPVGPVAAQAPPLGPRPTQLFRPAPAPLHRRPAGAIPAFPGPDSTSSNGALNGALVGAGIVGALGLFVGTAFRDEGCSSGAKWQAGLGGLAMGATIGAVLGGIIGSF